MIKKIEDMEYYNNKPIFILQEITKAELSSSLKLTNEMLIKIYS